MYKIKDENYKITAIFGNVRTLDLVTAYLIKLFKGKDVLLWQDKNLYFPSKRLQLSFGVDLVKLLKLHINDFDVLIVSNFKDGVNSFDNRKFVEEIRNIPEMRDKQVIIMYTAEKILGHKIDLSDFPNTIECSDRFFDNIFVVAKTNDLRGYVSRDLRNKEETPYKSYYDGINENLRRVSDD